MNNRMRIGVLIVAVLAASGTLFAYWQMRPDVPASTGEVATSTQEVIDEGTRLAKSDASVSASSTARVQPFTASLEAVMMSGEDYGCHYKGPADDGNFVGQVFVSEGRARGTLVGDTFDAPGSMVSFIITDEHTYLWFSSDAFDEPEIRGKALLLEATSTPDKLETKAQVMRNLTDLYGCVAWEFDPGFFTLPTDIPFYDAMIEHGS